MSSSTSRTLPESLLSRPPVQQLVADAQHSGRVSPEQVRAACKAAGLSAAQGRRIAKHLSEAGV
ncbi:MAG: hypothetical protein ACRDPG_01145, partial [Nocardioidaceae bacterium]